MMDAITNAGDSFPLSRPTPAHWEDLSAEQEEMVGVEALSDGLQESDGTGNNDTDEDEEEEEEDSVVTEAR